jgi:uncharacterized repeat protein (TIGR03803 family)
LTTLHSFDYTDGYIPVAGLVRGSDGNYYGTTYAGGSRYDGTIFEITASGTFTSLFDLGYPNGGNPTGEMTVAEDGSLFGTTYIGGAYGDGTIFKITDPSPPAFAVVVTPTHEGVKQGKTGSNTISIENFCGFVGTVKLSLSGVPTGVTPSLSTTSISGTSTSTATFVVSPTAPTGQSTITITGTSGTTVKTCTITFTVDPN